MRLRAPVRKDPHRIRALENILGYLPFLVYLDNLRYPLAGELSMHADLARIDRIPGDWGVGSGGVGGDISQLIP